MPLLQARTRHAPPASEGNNPGRSPLVCPLQTQMLQVLFLVEGKSCTSEWQPKDLINPSEHRCLTKLHSRRLPSVILTQHCSPVPRLTPRGRVRTSFALCAREQMLFWILAAE